MLFSFFVTCNKIGAFTLGGGYAMIPIMEREFVDHHKWMDKQEFMDISSAGYGEASWEP